MDAANNRSNNFIMVGLVEWESVTNRRWGRGDADPKLIVRSTQYCFLRDPGCDPSYSSPPFIFNDSRYIQYRLWSLDSLNRMNQSNVESKSCESVCVTRAKIDAPKTTKNVKVTRIFEPNLRSDS